MSQMTQYVYNGPIASVSLRIASRIVDVQLHPGKPVQLPAEHPYTQALVAQKRLVAVAPIESIEPQPAPDPGSSSPKGKARP